MQEVCKCFLLLLPYITAQVSLKKTYSNSTTCCWAFRGYRIYIQLHTGNKRMFLCFTKWPISISVFQSEMLLDKILWKCIWSLKEIENYLKIKNDNTVWQEGKNTKTHQHVLDLHHSGRWHYWTKTSPEHCRLASHCVSKKLTLTDADKETFQSRTGHHSFRAIRQPCQ